MRMNKKEKTKGGGLTVAGLLGVLFVALKLTGFIDWSWWLVTLPFWALLAIRLGYLLVLCLAWVAVAIVIAVMTKWESYWKERAKDDKA
jgi:hypothetical protein